MARWKFKDLKDYDDLEKFGKMRSRGKRVHTSRKGLQEEFILKEDKWPVVEGGFAARVVEVHKRHAFVSVEPTVGDIRTEDVWLSQIAGKFFTADRNERNFVVVGDRVLCRPAEGTEAEQNSDLPQCVIMHMAPRSSKISRVDPMYPEREHVLASNVDRLLIVASYLSPRVKWGLVDRYLVLAELQRLTPLIIFNKLDLLNEKKATHPEFYQECIERTAYYESLGYSVFVVQANRSRAMLAKGMRELAKVLNEGISLFSGHSGVGKSSICNLLHPEIEQDVEPNSDIFYKGRHTTSYASFIKLGKGGYAIDTPGIRSFVIQERSPIELSYGYRDIRVHSAACKFRECRHVDEPGCNVLKALSEGLIPEWRYKNYKGILLGTTGREGRVRDLDE